MAPLILPSNNSPGTVAYFFPREMAANPGETCDPEGRVCQNNGVMTGSAGFAKCKVICSTADGGSVTFSENIKHGIKMSKMPNGGQKIKLVGRAKPPR